MTRQVVLLAAGTGSRLAPLTDSMPKCLVRVGSTTFLDRMLSQVADAGVERAVIVTGHKSDRLMDHLAHHPPKLAVKFAYNPHYATSNNAVSLQCAHLALEPGGFILCDADVVLRRNPFKTLQRAPGPGFRRRFPIGALLLVYAAAVVAGAFFAPWHETWVALGRARLIWMAAGLGVCLAGAPVAATQWWLFVPRRYRLRWGRVFEITTLTSIARTVLPFFTGDLSALGLLVMRGGLDRGAALLVLGLDQLFTGIGKAALVCAAVVFAPLPASLATPGTTLIALVACALAAMLGAAHYRGSLDQLAAKSWPPLARAIRVIADLAQYLGLLRSPSRASGALALTVVKKSIEISATLAGPHAVGIAL